MCEMNTVFNKIIVTCIGLFSLTMNAFALEPITYLDENNEEKVVADYKEITGEETLLTRGWYVVKGDVATNVGKIEVRGNVHIVLADESRWYADNKLYFDGYTDYGVLNIYSQSHGDKEGEMSISTGYTRGDFCCCLYGLQIYGGKIDVTDLYNYRSILVNDVVLKNCSLNVNVPASTGIMCHNLICDGVDLTVSAYTGLVISESMELKNTHRTTNINVKNIVYGGSQDVVLPDGMKFESGGKVYTNVVPLDVIQKANNIKIGDAIDETTSIYCLEEVQLNKRSEGWLTLDGIRLTGKPTGKGIFIHNGRKVIMK